MEIPLKGANRVKIASRWRNHFGASAIEGIAEVAGQSLLIAVS